MALEALGRETDPKGNECLSFTGVKPGAAARELLPGFVGEALEQLPIPKRMRWGAGEAQFVRPVHWLVLLLGREVIPATVLDVDRAATRRVAIASMHRSRCASARPATYERTLEKRGKVVADFAARRERIRAGVERARHASRAARALISDALLDEVTALVEWPVPLAGRFEERFLALPRELLVSVLQDHQRYFPVEGADGKLLPWFITVSNVESTRHERGARRQRARGAPAPVGCGVLLGAGSQVAAGRAHCRSWMPSPSRRSWAPSATRCGASRRWRARSPRASTAMAPLAARAAQLAKCDLVTNLVGEFPELQGIMGRYYAAADGEPAEVAAAIAEHYQPRGAGDAMPATPAGLAVALADRSTRSPASSPSARSPAARRIRSRCAAPPSASAA